VGTRHAIRQQPQSGHVGRRDADAEHDLENEDALPI
jgi:hypothetical protein